jgi:hypothetical protein
MVGVANSLKSIPMSKITFLQVPTVYMTGENAGRVQPDLEKAQLVFDKLVNDEPIVLGKVTNTGAGSVVAPTRSPTPTPTKSSTATPKPTPTPTVTPLPDWAQGTNAATTTCSKGQ